MQFVQSGDNINQEALFDTIVLITYTMAIYCCRLPSICQSCLPNTLFEAEPFRFEAYIQFINSQRLIIMTAKRKYEIKNGNKTDIFTILPTLFSQSQLRKLQSAYITQFATGCQYVSIQYLFPLRPWSIVNTLPTATLSLIADELLRYIGGQRNYRSNLWVRCVSAITLGTIRKKTFVVIHKRLSLVVGFLPRYKFLFFSRY